MQTIAASVAKLVDTPSRSVAATAKPASRPSALKTPCLTQKPPGLDGADVSGSAELDQEVMRSARQAGIPEEQIAEMARLASRGRPNKDGRSSRLIFKTSHSFCRPFGRERGRSCRCRGDQLAEWRPDAGCCDQVDPDSCSVDQAKDAIPEFGVITGRKWFSSQFRSLFNIQSEVCSGTEGSSESTSPATPLHLQHDRAEHERRLPGADSTSRDSTSGLLSPSMVGTTISSSTFPDSCTPPLGHCRRAGLFTLQCPRGGTSSMCTPLSLRQPVVDRQGKLDSSIRDDAGRRATDEQFPVSHFAIGNRATIHPSDRRSLVGSVSGKVVRSRCPEREEEEIELQEASCGCCQCQGTTRGKPQIKGRRRKRKRKKGRGRRGRCSSDLKSHKVPLQEVVEAVTDMADPLKLAGAFLRPCRPLCLPMTTHHELANLQQSLL